MLCYHIATASYHLIVTLLFQSLCLSKKRNLHCSYIFNKLREGDAATPWRNRWFTTCLVIARECILGLEVSWQTMKVHERWQCFITTIALYMLNTKFNYNICSRFKMIMRLYTLHNKKLHFHWGQRNLCPGYFIGVSPNLTQQLLPVLQAKRGSIRSASFRFNT